MKEKLYLDTSVIGGYFDEEFSFWTKKLFDEFINGFKIAVISDITLFELKKAPDYVQNLLFEIPVYNLERIQFNSEAEFLTSKYIENNIVSKNYISDAQHIALASIEKINALVSWNFKHIVNLSKIRSFNSVNLKFGFPLLEIRTPREVLNEKEI